MKLSHRDRIFLRNFFRRMHELTGIPEGEVLAELWKTLEENEDFIVDEPSRSHAVMCASVLVWYERLVKEGMDGNRAIKLLEDAFVKSGGKYIVWYLRLMLMISWNRRKFLEGSLKRSAKAFGRTFKMEVESSKEELVLKVRRCGYYDFFKRYNKAELTRIFCAWDHLWANEVKRFGIDFSRPKTIAQGDRECIFKFAFKN